MTDELLWKDFDVNTERVYSAVNDGTKIRIHVPERVRALRDMVPTDEEVAAGDTFGSRNRLATQYALEGDVVDTQIDVWAWGAANTYDQRRGYGYESVPAVLQQYRIWTPPGPEPKESA